MRNVIRAAAMVLALAVAGPAVAGQFEDAMAAYQREDFLTARQLWQPLGDQGDAAAQFSLGFMYQKGKGVPQDDMLAVKWYRQAADQGLANAQNNLGLMYHNGQGVPQDYRLAVKWNRQAADQGLAGAQNNLGFMYYNGQGVPKDYVLAYMWSNLAAAGGDPKTLELRDALEAKMTATQIVEAQLLSREWKPKTK